MSPLPLLAVFPSGGRPNLPPIVAEANESGCHHADRDHCNGPDIHFRHSTTGRSNAP